MSPTCLFQILSHLYISVTAQTSQAMTPSVFMYQTPQGIVYAPATGPMQDKAIFSFQQPTHTITVSQPDANGV